jgi:hypothetical protein
MVENDAKPAPKSLGRHRTRDSAEHLLAYNRTDSRQSETENVVRQATCSAAASAAIGATAPAASELALQKG